MSLEPLLQYNQLFAKSTLNHSKSEDCVERTEHFITEEKRLKIVFSKPGNVFASEASVERTELFKTEEKRPELSKPAEDVLPEASVKRTELFTAEEKQHKSFSAEPANFSHQTTLASSTTMDSSELHDYHQDGYPEDGAIQRNIGGLDVSQLPDVNLPSQRRRDPRLFARNLHYVYFDGPRHRKVYLGVYSVKNGALVCESVREVDPFCEHHPDFGPRPTFIVPPSHYYQHQQGRHLQGPRKHSL